jgi:CheY-like chemotaxis protein
MADPVAQDIEAERELLQAERAACEGRLAQLKSALDTNAHAQERSREETVRGNQAKLDFLAAISPDLRAPLHAILGYAELLRREGGLSQSQAMRVNAMLDAGMRLLDRFNCVLTLSERELDGTPGPRDDAALALMEGEESTALQVLVVDDVAMNRDIAAAFLGAAGHRVITAEDGPHAVLAAGAADIDVILMDVRMPGMDGLEATRRIRALDGPRGQVPVVALTALAFTEQVAECRKAGMNGHLAKPFSPETLCRAISLAASGRARPAPVPRAALPRLPVVSLAAFKRGGPGQAGEGAPRNAAGTGVDHWDGGGAYHGNQAWIDIVSPWTRTTSAMALTGGAPGAVMRRPEESGFVLRLAPVASKWGDLLVDAKLTCEPPPEHGFCEFHWLLFAQATPGRQQGFSAACDLWRWNGTGWRSITVPGAQFSPAELHDQGWRYCGPCPGKVAQVEILPAGFMRRDETADGRSQDGSPPR